MNDIIDCYKLQFALLSGQRGRGTPRSEEQRAKGKGQRPKSKEQRAEGKEQRVRSPELGAKCTHACRQAGSRKRGAKSREHGAESGRLHASIGHRAKGTEHRAKSRERADLPTGRQVTGYGLKCGIPMKEHCRTVTGASSHPPWVNNRHGPGGRGQRAKREEGCWLLVACCPAGAGFGYGRFSIPLRSNSLPAYRTGRLVARLQVRQAGNPVLRLCAFA
jgi:hypothetical protein